MDEKMPHIEIIEKKIKQYEGDLKLMIKSSKSIDRIKTARIKSEFEDLFAEKIIDLGKSITDLKDFIKQEKGDTNE